MRARWLDRPRDGYEKFSRPGAHAAVRPVERHLARLELVWVDDEHRGQGVGTAVLLDVHRWADLYRYHLYAVVMSLSQSGLDEDALYAWYERHGWERVRLNGEDVIVRPTPNAPVLT